MPKPPPKTKAPQNPHGAGLPPAGKGGKDQALVGSGEGNGAKRATISPPAALATTKAPERVEVRRVEKPPAKSNLLSGGPNGRGGPREGSGRKPDVVKALERELMDAMYAVPERVTDDKGNVTVKPGATKKELGQMCVERLVEILHGDDIPSAVRAADILLSRKFGKAAEHREVKVDQQTKVGLYIVPPPAITKLPGAGE